MYRLVRLQPGREGREQPRSSRPVDQSDFDLLVRRDLQLAPVHHVLCGSPIQIEELNQRKFPR
jgi:hypothetical protein